MKCYDLSHYQIVDWKKFKADCVIAKCTEGLTYIDATYLDKKKNCRDKGILFGSYHFANGLDAKKEAIFFIKTVGDILENEFLILDYEIHLSDPVTWCKTFLDTVSDLVGFRPLIYLNSSTEKSFNWSSVSKKYGLWLANYGVNDGKEYPYPSLKNWNVAVLHQYTSAGIVAGIKGRVDVNSGNLETLKKYGKIEPTPSKNIQIAPYISNDPKNPPQVITVPQEASTTLNPQSQIDNSTANVENGSVTVESHITEDSKKVVDNSLWQLILEFIKLIFKIK